ncbi:MAG: Na(+)-translocating NADH-quinone reductase subunit A, partial [Muribaculaceae bacterium]|nr:Na(+)-translocating NADH-quinone reductase subunit A [Muribaculaceae bacterium]
YITPKTIALIPDDFPGLTLKPVVKEGDSVKGGQAVLADKRHPEIVLTSPAGGKIKAIVRGERRKLLRIEITPDASATSFNIPLTTSADAGGVKSALQSSGLWSMIRQRPYDIVAEPDKEPRDIYITTLDTAPLAGNFDAVLAKNSDLLEAGVAALQKLTKGKVYVARREGSPIPDIKGAEMVNVGGPHPSGNPGVIIANTHPVNKGETVWTMDGLTLLRIGQLLSQNLLSFETTIVLTGSEVENPGYIKTAIGADIESLTTGRIVKTGEHKRFISGNVFTGDNVGPDGYLRNPYRQITVIPEGDDVTEFMGWASISPKKMSVSRSFPGHFLHKLFNPDARLLGGRRAMIMSGEYDKVVPMDIMTEYLVKAILSRNIEQMEALGIYEIAPEDVAVAEYVCTSKMPLQSIIREGLEYLRKELE